ncbi:Two-component response regulator, YesN/AraC family, consists of REC and AraC-type DNA-binding domains [Paenibacillus algorifonticola]|uniref:Two-component response regulator, YesN/AraC family, consists of REC and AraC-type DNA-binding domains n=1 Tax=Paenibacillus algorifonticola TaxID=684063 RepID=A0A1I2CRQ2_9BACL|nr:AraC family transcriptional regulator [Paenibacillus algorifonticola]SFE70852.1 Two-component response regulator, YesN/AraC family, consists of REC and AraC-type DNA-binding domains [Paenibacillus algorifonticola]
MKKWNSVFANLAISYLSIVLVIVLLLCSVFYIYFSRSYEEELHSKNQLILENTAQTIETTVLQRVQQIYLNLSLDKTTDFRLFADSSYKNNLSKAIDLQELLQSEVAANSDIVYAAHLYYPKQNVMLSSNYGLRFNAEQGSSAVFFADWMNGMRGNTQSHLWTPTRLIPQDIYSSLQGNKSEALITYTHSYPFQASGENSDLMIAIDVKESAISRVIRNMMPTQYESTFILDRTGSTITSSDHESLGLHNANSSSVTESLLSKAETGSFNDTINDGSYAVSYLTLPSTGWKIYSAMPASFFYQKLIFVQKLVLVICVVALLIGIVLSGIFARASYSPIKRLAGRIKDISGHTPENVTNEFKLIDTAFIRLNDKVSSLEETLHANSSVIRHNALLNLLHNSNTREKLAEELPFLGISQEYTHYCSMIVNSGQAYAHLSSKDMQYVVYRMINQLEGASLPEAHIIAEELPDKTIVILVCAGQTCDVFLEQLSRFVLAEAKQQFQLDFQISQGCWVQDIIDVHQSYMEAQSLIKYSYFLPDRSILNDRALLDRENSLEEIPQAMLMRFREKLHARQSHEIAATVEQLVLTMREGMYSADYCRFILANTVYVYSDYLKSVRYQQHDQGNLDLYNQYNEISNIYHFQEWLVSSISACLAQMEKRNNDRAVSSIDAAKQYIRDHLSDDLSLETVAAQVFISPKYLSKLFKEENGITYTDYVTSQRMDRAAVLIENNNMSVEQIASTVGYRTAAYFIKKFKERHGCTPGNYLRHTVKQA